MEQIDEKKTIVVLNKIDLPAKIDESAVRDILPNAYVMKTSMETQEGIGDIEEKIVSMVYDGKVSQNNSLIVTNVRHKDILVKAEKSLGDAIAMTQMGEALEFIEIDINSAYASLGEIIGETVQDDIINEVFSRFCLGK